MFDGDDYRLRSGILGLGLDTGIGDRLG